MLRNLFILLNVAFIAGFKTLSDGGKVKLTQRIPSNVLTGTDFIEEIDISKPASVSTFAKFEQQLPKGMVAVGLDLKGGTLTQDENNLVKIVWYKLTDINEFTIKLRILVDYETSLNEYAISSRFAYLEDNDRKSVDSEMSKILVEKGEDIPIDENEKELTKIADTAVHRALTDNIDKMLRETGLACTQVSDMLSMSEAKVDIRVIKGKVSGFAKIEEPVCEGLTAVNLENGGAVFSFVDGKVKYVWTNLPEGQNVKVSFKLVRNKDAAWMKRCTVEGEFSYLEGDKSMRCNYNSVTIDYEKGITISNVVKPQNQVQPPAQVQAKPEEKPQPVKTEEIAVSQNNAAVKDTPVIAQKKPELPTEVKTENNIAKTDDKPVTNQKSAGDQNITSYSKAKSTEVNTTAKTETPAATKKKDEIVNNNQGVTQNALAGLVFKVQVCATHRTVDATFVKNNYKLADEVMQEMHEGWFKFTVGGYGQYTEARNKREDLAPFNLPGPFVTAYNNGNRITVQEALMISKQQWVK